MCAGSANPQDVVRTRDLVTEAALADWVRIHLASRAAGAAFRFLLADTGMLAGEARDIVSDRADYLGVQPAQSPPRTA